MSDLPVTTLGPPRTVVIQLAAIARTAAIPAARTSVPGGPGLATVPPRETSPRPVVPARPIARSADITSVRSPRVGPSTAVPPEVLPRADVRVPPATRLAVVATTVARIAVPRVARRTGGSPAAQGLVLSATPVTVAPPRVAQSAQTSRVAPLRPAVAGMIARLATAGRAVRAAMGAAIGPARAAQGVTLRAGRRAVGIGTVPAARRTVVIDTAPDVHRVIATRTAIGVPPETAAATVPALPARPVTDRQVVVGSNDRHLPRRVTSVPRVDRAAADAMRKWTTSRRGDRGRPGALRLRCLLTPTRSCSTRPSDRSFGR